MAPFSRGSARQPVQHTPQRCGRNPQGQALVLSAMGGLVPASLLSSVPQVTVTPAHAALAVGLLMQGSNLGQALGPLLVGKAVDHHGWPAAAVRVVIAALAMAGAVRWRVGAEGS
ncbi:hypothetical protein [Acidovorax sp. A1169]|uniref:hypothetical protein n=1 Tax=Acidovorax sp. A1169 TaxID=3059524 RepID=UPI002737F331|nr:hypothetical protein [Acidovorax sp. A1169]MDP4078343.1 hypothetical protein [Acidovorax sp. A1169]